MTDPAISGVFREPFQEQVAFFRQKLGNLVPTERWTDMQKEAHDKGFMVAGAAKADLLSDLAAAVDKAISQGTSLDAFRKDFKAIAARKGWDYRGEFNWRTKVIYQTNMATSYAAGRLAQLREAGFTHWEYIHSNAVAHPRKQHLGWNGLVLPADDPFWNTHYPPNGWGCQCRVKGKNNPAQVGQAPDEEIDPRTGEPVGIDKGWGYQPGNTVSDTVRAIADKLPRLPAQIGASMASLWSERDYKAMTNNFSGFVDTVETELVARGKSIVVGAIKSEWIKKLDELGVAPETAEMIVRDSDLLHTFRNVKNNPLPLDWYKQIPQLVRNPQAVILDQSHNDGNALLLVFDVKSNKGKKLLLRLDYHVKKLGKVNILGTGHFVDVDGMKGQPNYTYIEGKI